MTKPPPALSNDARISTSFADPDWYITGFSANIRVRRETVAMLTQGRSFDSILDIGCGDGTISLQLTAQTKNITFLDQSPAMLARVESNLKGHSETRVSYINCGFMEADLPKSGFDLIICVGVLAYVEDVNSFIARVRSLLRPGGMLILECTDGFHFVSRFVRAYRSITGLLKPKRFKTHLHRSGDVIQIAMRYDLRLQQHFRYFYNLPVLEKFIVGEKAYRWIRRIFGDISNNRNGWLGKEHLFCFASK